MEDQFRPKTPKIVIPKIPDYVLNPVSIMRTFDATTVLSAKVNQANDILSRIQINPIQEVLNKAAGQASLAEAAKGYFSQQERLAKAVQSSLGEGFLAYTEQLTKQAMALARLDLQPIEEEVLTDPMSQLACEFGWPPLYHVPVGFTNHLLEEASSMESNLQKREFIDQEITDYFSGEQLQELLNGWRQKEYLQGTERLFIIEAALDSYENGNYSLASPALLPQIEGLYCEHIVGDIVVVSEKHYEEQVKRLKEEAGLDHLDVGLNEVLFEFVQMHGFFGFKDEKNPDKNPISQDISRHKILHGQSTAYCNRQEISLRHLLWLDCVMALIDLVADIQSKREDG